MYFYRMPNIFFLVLHLSCPGTSVLTFPVGDKKCILPNPNNIKNFYNIKIYILKSKI